MPTKDNWHRFYISCHRPLETILALMSHVFFCQSTLSFSMRKQPHDVVACRCTTLKLSITDTHWCSICSSLSMLHHLLVRFPVESLIIKANIGATAGQALSRILRPRLPSTPRFWILVKPAMVIPQSKRHHHLSHLESCCICLVFVVLFILI